MILVRLMCNWIMIGPFYRRRKNRGKLLMLGARLVEEVENEIYRAAHRWRLGVLRLGS